MTLEEYFSTGPPHERPIFDAVMAGLAGVGPILVEPVSVGLFLKRSQSFCELRPRNKWVNVSFGLPRRLHDARVRRAEDYSASSTYHWVRVNDASEVDDQLIGWLTEAYLASPE